MKHHLQVCEPELPKHKASSWFYLLLCARDLQMAQFQGLQQGWPILMAFRASSLHKGRHHHHQGALRFYDHLPEVYNSVQQWT
jgi:hypothetical protein